MPQPARGRKPRACDSCRSKKIQCDRAVPRCDYCEHHGLTCTYNQAARRSRPKLFSNQNLELPKELASAQLNVEVDLGHYKLTAAPSSFEAGHSQTYLDGFYLLNGLPLFSEQGQQWIEERTGTRLSANVLDKCRSPWQTHPYVAHPKLTTPSSTKDQDTLRLPPAKVVEKVGEGFCSSIHSLIFPVFSLGLFVSRTLPLAYHKSPQNQYAVGSAKACVRGMLVLSDIFGHNTDRDVSDLADTSHRYAVEIEESIPIILREMTLDGLEALTVLVVYKYFMGDLQDASFLLAICTRLIFKLGAHMPPRTAEPYDKNNQEHHKRDIFWVCYCLDKDLTHRIIQPTAFNDDHCDLALPINYAQMQSSNILNLNRYSIPSSTTVPLYPWDLRLSTIKSRIYDSIYSISASRQPQAEILRRIRCLDEDLDAWRLTLPPDHRPTLSFSDQTPVDIHTNTQAVMLRLSYHQSVILIHKARYRMVELGSSISDLVDDGLNFQLLIDASKSILIYLERALPVLAHECFWVIIFYPMTAIFTIFSIALLNKRDVSMSQNLAIMQDFTRIIRQIPIRRLTVAEISHLEFIEILISDMGRLVLAASKEPGYS